MLETVYKCGTLIFCFNLPSFGIYKSSLHCHKAEFLGGGVMLMHGIHARGVLRGKWNGGVLGEIRVGGKSRLGSFSRQLWNHMESALWGDPILM